MIILSLFLSPKALTPVLHPPPSLPPLMMSNFTLDTRRNETTHRYEFDNMKVSLRFASTSSVSGDGPGRAMLMIRYRDDIYVVGEPTGGPGRRRVFSGEMGDSWSENLPDLAEQTFCWASVSAVMDRVPLHAHVRDHFKPAMVHDLLDAAVKAVFLNHHNLVVSFDLLVETEIPYQNNGPNVRNEAESDEEEDMDQEEEEEEEEDDGLSKAAIDHYVTMDRVDGPGPLDTCVVCMEEIERGRMTGKLPCKHLFHSDCITTWLQRKNRCPICWHEMHKVLFG